jgi:bacterioferritin (cytochrome b1)
MIYSELESINKDLKTLDDRVKIIINQEESKDLIDSSLITGHLDDLEEVREALKDALDLLDTITGDPTP